MSDSAVRELRISLRWGSLAAKAWGDPSHPPLLALHGWLDNAASFDALAPLIADRHVIALDLSGHGRSDWRPDGAWDFWVDHLHDVDQVISHFGWPRVDLLGHSMGGTLASTYAATFPERVDQLVLIEALGPMPGSEGASLQQLRKGLLARRESEPRRLRVFSSVDEAAQARVKANGLSLDAARLLVSRGLIAVAADGEQGAGYSWSSDPRLTLPSLQRYCEVQVDNLLDGLLAPTLLVLADPAQIYALPTLIERRIARVATIQCHRLPGNHHLHLEDPQPIADLINAFLAEARLEPAPTPASA